MFCKFCGGPIDRSSMNCTDCGRPAGPLADEGSFRDLLRSAMDGGAAGRKAMIDREAAGREAPPAGDEVGQLRKDLYNAEKRRDAGEKKAAARDKRTMLLSGLSSVLSLVLLLVMALTATAANRERKTLYEELAALKTGLSSGTETGEEVQPGTEPVQDGQAGTDPAEDGTVYISKHPEDSHDVRYGTTNKAFIVRAAGENISFVWRYYSEDSGQWEEIVSDDKDYSIENSKNESVLSIINADERQAGTYDCVIRDAQGNAILYSAPAVLTMEEKSEMDIPGLFGNKDDGGDESPSQPSAGGETSGDGGDDAQAEPSAPVNGGGTEKPTETGVPQPDG